MMSHQGRVAVVTGSAQGIGQSVAIELARRGAKVVLVDLNESLRTCELVREAGGQAVIVCADVSVEDDWERISTTCRREFGSGDIVVNNAGVYPKCPFDALDAALWQKTFAVNVDAHFYSAKAFVPMMRERSWGRFVNISSNSIGYPVQSLSHYLASKMAAIGFVRGLANEVGEFGITVNAILPAPTETPGTAHVPEEAKRMLIQTQAIKRFSVPSDIVGPTAFLTSDDAAFITGQAVVVDGGAYKIS